MVHRLLPYPASLNPVVTNPEVTNPFRTTSPQRKNRKDVTCFTKGPADIGTDYALIAGGVAATLIALTYLILI